MVKYQGPSRRSITGALRKGSKTKKLRLLARPPTETHIGPRKIKKIRTLGGNRKIRVQKENRVNVLDPETKKVQNVTIKGLETNPASRDYSRRKILTKGAIIETELGLARISNRPGNDAVINAVLVKN
jgi:small subunit ribosomal protein S8e